MRVLHLVLPPTTRDRAGSGAPVDSGLLACRAVIESAPSIDHRVCVVGGTDEESRARQCGLSTVDRVSAPLSQPLLAWRGLRALFLERGPGLIVQCWHPTLTRPARLAAGRHARVFGPPPEWPVPLASGVEAARESIRTELQIGPDEPTALLVADPPVAARAKPFMFVVGIIEVAEVHTVGLIPSPCGDYARSKLYYRSALMGARTLSCTAPSVALLAAADIAVLDPMRSTDREHRGQAGPSERALVAYAHRLGVPVVTPLLDGLEDLYPEETRASCVAHADRSSDVGRRIAPLLRDTAVRRTIAGRLAAAAETWISAHQATDRVLRAWGAELPAGAASI